MLVVAWAAWHTFRQTPWVLVVLFVCATMCTCVLYASSGSSSAAAASDAVLVDWAGSTVLTVLGVGKGF